MSEALIWKVNELRNALKSGDDPISNATINTLFASLSSAYGYFVEQGWCSENPLRLIEDLEVAERPFNGSGPARSPPSRKRL